MRSHTIPDMKVQYPILMVMISILKSGVFLAPAHNP